MKRPAWWETGLEASAQTDIPRGGICQVSSRARRALAGLVTAAAALALPAAASATITPALTLTQSTTTAGTSPATVGFDTMFSPSAGDSPKDITFALPPGLLANANQAGGACLASPTPNAACQVGSGTLTAAVGPRRRSRCIWSRRRAASGRRRRCARAGHQPTGRSLSTADVTLRTTPTVGLDVAFSNLPQHGISEINVTFTTLRLPTSCPSPPANVTVTADSHGSATPKTAAAPLNVTGCSGLPYNPTVSATETKDAKDSGATLLFSDHPGR